MRKTLDEGTAAEPNEGIDQKTALESLREKEEQYRGVFEATSDGLVINDMEGNVVEVNPAFARMHGYTREEMVGMPPPQFIHPNSHELLRQFMETVRAGGEFHCQAMDVRKDGTAFHVDVLGMTFLYRGEPHILGVVRDITERVQTYEQLRLKEEQYRAVFEATTDGLAIADLDANVVEVNPAWCNMHGYTREEMLKLHPSAYVHPDSLALLAEYYQKVRAGEHFRAEAMDIRKDGTPFHVEVHETPIMYDGQLHTLTVLRDITERVESEERIRMREEQYRSIFEATSDGLVISDLDGNVIEVNPAFANMLGYTREELVGMDPRQWIHPDSHANLVEYLEKVRAGERFRTEGVQVRKDGTLFPAEVHEAPFIYNGQRHTLAIIRDITERVQARELLEQRVEERTRELATLLEVSSNVASTLELEPLLKRILEQLKLVTAYRRATVAVNEPDEVMMLNSWGDNSIQTPAPGRPLPVDSFGPIGAAIRRGEPVIIPDVLEEGVYAETMRDRTAAAMANDPLVTETLEERLMSERCVMYVPMMLKGKMVGGLILRHSEPGYYKERHADLAMAIAHQAAIAIENARLYRQAQETARKTAALAQIASQVAFGGSLGSTLQVLCRHIVDVTGAVASAVVLRDAESGQTRMVGTYGLPEGYADALNAILASGATLLVQQAFTEARPLFLRDMRESILNSPAYAPLHSFMHEVPWDGVVAVPMIYQGSAVGVLFSYHLPTRNIGEAELTFHNMIADQAAVAVQNSYLLAQAHDKTRLEERQRLARELHDSVTQALFSISLTARSAEVVLQREGSHSKDTLEKLADLRQLTQGALAEMRALIFELRPGALEEEGLVEALRKHAAAVQGREMLQVEVTVSSAGGEMPRLKPVAEEALYRIAQEALHNIVKHARASRVEMSIEAEPGLVTLRVSDDGIGFDIARVPPGHMGLGTMRQRAEALGGEYKVESRPGEGTTVTVRVPLQEWSLPG
ncbi:MAG TPA: PAS domain S-box protein [Chloroflexia bacterium]|nr:PAS domain S-box protein [Chloroflexia bacterium]